MQHISVYVSDEDAAVLAESGKRDGLGISAVARMGIRRMIEAASPELKLNARRALEEARENAGAMDVTDLESAPWSGQSKE